MREASYKVLYGPLADLADLIATAYARVNIFTAASSQLIAPATFLGGEGEKMFFFSHRGAGECDQGLPSRRSTLWRLAFGWLTSIASGSAKVCQVRGPQHRGRQFPAPAEH